jgi:hypothetical protein
MNKLLTYDFEDAEEVDGNASGPIPAEKALMAFPILAFRDIRLDPKRRNYLVKGLLPRSGLVVIWGPPKCYKSFWTMDVAFFIAIGQEYRGRRVQQAPVVYIILEGREGLPARKEVLARHYGIDDPPLYFVTTALNLAKHAEALAASIEAQPRCVQAPRRAPVDQSGARGGSQSDCGRSRCEGWAYQGHQRRQS